MGYIFDMHPIARYIFFSIVVVVLSVYGYQEFSPTGMRCKQLGGQYFMHGGCVKINVVTERIAID